MTAAEKTKKSRKPLPVYVIFGSDDFLRLQALDDVIERVLGKDRDSMAVAEFDGRSAELSDVLDECRTLSLLASTRLVCVRDADDFVTAHRAALEKYLQSPSPTGVLVLVCSKWDARWRIYKLVDEIGCKIR